MFLTNEDLISKIIEDMELLGATFFHAKEYTNIVYRGEIIGTATESVLKTTYCCIGVANFNWWTNFEDKDPLSSYIWRLRNLEREEALYFYVNPE